MHPSEMTPDELRLAIAEELGWTNINEYGLGKSPDGWDFQVVPNWPSDNNAARELLEEIGKVTIYKDNNLWNVGILDFPKDEDEHWSINESFPRAICEAWLTARRNDG